ncbi:UNVERIFIED_CONTAM: hypothetical protein K2H54_028615 [Gekko kuhli]
MGENTGPKGRSSQKETPPVKSFIPRGEATAAKGNTEAELLKMAAATESGDTGARYVTKEDLFELKFEIAKSIKEAFDEKLDPVNAKLTEITTDLKEASKKAKLAMELGETLQEEIKNLQGREQVLSNKICNLEQCWRQQNLKFRVLEKNVEGNIDLAIFISSWLAKMLSLEEGLAPAIAHAYRIGPMALSKRGRSRDIIAQFVYPRTRDRGKKKRNTIL